MSTSFAAGWRMQKRLFSTSARLCGRKKIGAPPGSLSQFTSPSQVVARRKPAVLSGLKHARRRDQPEGIAFNHNNSDPTVDTTTNNQGFAEEFSAGESASAGSATVFERQAFLDQVEVERRRLREARRAEQIRRNSSQGSAADSHTPAIPLSETQQQVSDLPTVGIKKSPKRLVNVSYISLSPSDQHFTRSLTLARNQKTRFDKRRRLVLEGVRLVREAFVAPSIFVHDVFFSNEAVLEQAVDIVGAIQKSDNQIQLYRVTPQQMKMWSELVTPPGFMATTAIPDIDIILSKRNNQHAQRTQPVSKTLHAQHRPPLNLSVICDAIRDPTNMGALLRSCAAAGVKAVYTTRACCDPLGPKALRAAMGAQFYLPIYMTEANSVEEIVNNHIINSSANFLATDADDAENLLQLFVAYSPHPYDEADAVENVERSNTKVIYQPTPPGTTKNDQRKFSKYAAINTALLNQVVPFDYYDVDFVRATSSSVECALVVGGEVGLSFKTLQLLSRSNNAIANDADGSEMETNGEFELPENDENSIRNRRNSFKAVPIRIPLDATIDSLNLAHAASIILFEARRQVDMAASSTYAERDDVLAARGTN